MKLYLLASFIFYLIVTLNADYRATFDEDLFLTSILENHFKEIDRYKRDTTLTSTNNTESTNTTELEKSKKNYVDSITKDEGELSEDTYTNFIEGVNLPADNTDKYSRSYLTSNDPDNLEEFAVEGGTDLSTTNYGVNYNDIGDRGTSSTENTGYYQSGSDYGGDLADGADSKEYFGTDHEANAQQIVEEPITESYYHPLRIGDLQASDTGYQQIGMSKLPTGDSDYQQSHQIELDSGYDNLNNAVNKAKAYESRYSQAPEVRPNQDLIDYQNAQMSRPGSYELGDQNSNSVQPNAETPTPSNIGPLYQGKNGQKYPPGSSRIGMRKPAYTPPSNNYIYKASPNRRRPRINTSGRINGSGNVPLSNPVPFSPHRAKNVNLLYPSDNRNTNRKPRVGGRKKVQPDRQNGPVMPQFMSMAGRQSKNILATNGMSPKELADENDVDETVIEVVFDCSNCETNCPETCNNAVNNTVTVINHHCCANNVLVIPKLCPSCAYIDTSSCPVTGQEYDKFNEMYYIVEMGLKETYKPEFLVTGSKEFQRIRNMCQFFVLRVYHDHPYYQETIIRSIKSSKDYSIVTMLIRFTKPSFGNIQPFYKAVYCKCGCELFYPDLAFKLAPANTSDIWEFCPPRCLEPSQCDSDNSCKGCCNGLPMGTYVLGKLPDQFLPSMMAPMPVVGMGLPVSPEQLFCSESCPLSCHPSCSLECCTSPPGFKRSIRRTPFSNTRPKLAN